MKDKLHLISDDEADELIRQFGQATQSTGINDQDFNPKDSFSHDGHYYGEDDRQHEVFSTSSDDSAAISGPDSEAGYDFPEQTFVSEGGKNITRDKNGADSKNTISSAGRKVGAVILCVLLMTWLLPSGNVMNLQTTSSSSKDRFTFFQNASNGLLSDSLNEIHRIPRSYVLELSDVLTPAPDESSFTERMDEVRKNYDDTPIRYYKDDSIEVKCWKEMRQGAVFNFSEVWISHPSQLRRTLVDNVISKKHRDFPQNIFGRTNGVVGMSADYCAFRAYGIVIQFGNVIRTKTSGFMDIAVYDKNGNFSTLKDNPDFFESDIYKNGDIIHTFAFGPMLVDNYTVNDSTLLTNPRAQGEPTRHDPRAAICQFDYDKHYLLCTVDAPGITMLDFAKEIQTTGVRFAYNLDGGQTATLLYNKEIINIVAYGGPRDMSDILYFATAVPND